MGIPVSPKNIFPSNIQGLPTWYEVRVSEAGYLARRDGIDLMVAMNPQTYKEDLAEIVPGGWLLYDSTLPRIWPRDDITVLGIPIAEMCAREVERPAPAPAVQEHGLRRRADGAARHRPGGAARARSPTSSRARRSWSPPTWRRSRWGATTRPRTSTARCRSSVRHAEGAKGKILVTGNDAAGLGAIYAGATVCAWYPITPSTSLAEAFEKYAKRLRVTKDGRRLYGIVQAEDELAAIGVAIGGGWNGARSFTATSGPGISLMSEFLGLAYFAEVPVVLFNIQRGGPSTGMPTRTQQSDIISCAYASHGDTKHVLLFPQGPHRVLLDGRGGLRSRRAAADAGDRHVRPRHRHERLGDRRRSPGTTANVHDRGKVLDAEQLDKFKELKGRDWGRYQDIDGDAIPYRTLPGTHPTKGAFFTRGTSHDENARYTEDGRIHARVHRPHPPQVRHGRHAGAEARDHHPRQGRQDRPHLLRRQRAGRARGARRCSSATASRSTPCASRPSPSRARSWPSAPRTSASSSSSRTATRRCARC